MDTTYETIGTAQALKDAGVEPKHAEAIAEAIIRNRGELATKSDLGSMRSELKNDNNWLKWGLGINIVETLSIIAILITDK